ncbi:MAG: hypothetical protein VX075_14770, partial [Pseudomonadota bacterium]|nr:hypothetical protein [Pseudomonadota bacterium]
MVHIAFGAMLVPSRSINFQHDFIPDFIPPNLAKYLFKQGRVPTSKNRLRAPWLRIPSYVEVVQIAFGAMLAPSRSINFQHDFIPDFIPPNLAKYLFKQGRVPTHKNRLRALWLRIPSYVEVVHIAFGAMLAPSRSINFQHDFIPDFIPPNLAKYLFKQGRVPTYKNRLRALWLRIPSYVEVVHIACGAMLAPSRSINFQHDFIPDLIPPNLA